MNRSKTVAFLWLFSALLFYSLFQMALRNSDSSHNYTSASDSMVSNKEQRSALYDRMARDLDQHGPLFLQHGHTSQSLSLSDIFTIKDGSVAPILKAANPPVRANVLHLSTQYSVPISEALKPILDPYFDKVIWFQNSSLYHFSMFHASHHISPVPATQDEIEAEAAAVRAVTQELCPLKIVLDRVVLTSTGVLLGCWQMLSNTGDQVHFFHGLVDRLNNELRGFEAVISELWYVEEFDVLALALNGRMKMRRFQLGCSRN
ncbi:uncharacterized protein LOC117627677 isoform X2 [Prunus dulcis]|uniref:uncharacterized protein LOC117627677 isoform X2 n=1 Tax=Prunus dulcis TaxID=3755 RepID=UPI0014821AC2|nr:uncharacterized protein LOC117627677 isoform X2 [Prunus dulcis]